MFYSDITSSEYCQVNYVLSFVWMFRWRYLGKWFEDCWKRPNHESIFFIQTTDNLRKIHFVSLIMRFRVAPISEKYFCAIIKRIVVKRNVTAHQTIELMNSIEFWILLNIIEYYSVLYIQHTEDSHIALYSTYRRFSYLCMQSLSIAYTEKWE